MAQTPPAEGADQPVQRSALITEPLSSHPVETMLAACRAAIANGEDVNAPDTLPHVQFNAGRPLDACLRQSHMSSTKSCHENLPVIELLLEHGADPRLYSKSVGVLGIPMSLARRHAVDEEKEEHRAWWKHLLGLFEEAVLRIDAKKEEGKETEGDG